MALQQRAGSLSHSAPNELDTPADLNDAMILPALHLSPLESGRDAGETLASPASVAQPGNQADQEIARGGAPRAAQSPSAARPRRFIFRLGVAAAMLLCASIAAVWLLQPPASHAVVTDAIWRSVRGR